MTLLEVEKVDVSYGPIKTLWDVSLEVFEGEIVGIFGPNGTGKSTLLKTILGVNRLLKGKIMFKGKRIDGLPTYKIVEEGICYVPEGRGIFPEMTVYENLEMGALTKRAKVLKNENIKRVFEIFPILREKKERLAITLSGGEMQMLAIARGLMSAPQLLMLDEPSLGLAPKIITKLLLTLKEINQQGVSLLIAEQNVNTIKICNRFYLLENGRVIFEGESSRMVESEYLKKVYLGR